MNKLIALFDGNCIACSRLVNFVSKRSNSITFVPLQSDTARSLLHNNVSFLLNLNTLVVIHNHSVYQKSNAVLHIARNMNGPWPVLTVFKLIPEFLRNLVYDFIARNRYRIFGRNTVCTLHP